VIPLWYAKMWWVIAFVTGVLNGIAIMVWIKDKNGKG